MNSLMAVTFFCVVAMATSSLDDNQGYDSYDGPDGGNRGFGYGFSRTDKGFEAVYNNAARQLGVNRLAENVGASSGTAYRYGVPGTGNYFPNNRRSTNDDSYNRGY